MANVISHHTISLDGFVAGSDDALEWVVECGAATSLAEETMGRIGAIVAGRRWYELAKVRWDGVEGIYGGAQDGDVLVLTSRPPDEGEESVHFVPTGIEDAVARAKESAEVKDVGVFGGDLTRQCLDRGLLDEVVLHLAPVLLGGGVRLFGDAGRQVELERVGLGEAERLTDLRFRVGR